MAEKRSTLGFTGIAIGSIALLLVLVHFYAGPFSPQPTIETTIAEKAVSIRDAAVAIGALIIAIILAAVISQLGIDL